MLNAIKPSKLRNILSFAFAARLAALCSPLFLFGCGGGGSSTTPIIPNPPNGSSLSFSLPTNISTGGIHSGSVAIADFNGDGKPDIVVSNFTSNTISVFLNKGDGTFHDPIVAPVQIDAVGLGALAVGDFNEDGKPDLVLATIAGSQADIVLLGNGDGTFRQLPPIPNSFGFFHARVADLNGDGHQDLVTGMNGSIVVYLGKGDGTFTEATTPFSTGFGGTYFGIVVGDFNGDHKLDILGLAYQSPTQTAPLGGALVFAAGNGDGTFQTPTSVPVLPSFPGSLVSADFLANGKQDLLIGFPNTAALAKGNGDGTFDLNTNDYIFAYSSSDFDQTNGMILQSADFDLDGKADVLVGDYKLGIVTLLLNPGIGKAVPPTGTKFQFNLGATVNDIAVGDLNGDGLPDIVVCNGTTNEISVILSHKN